MIQRQVRKTETGPGRYRYRVVVTGEPCPPNTHEARQHQHLFFQWLADNQHMLHCGYSVPARVLITHNGTAWQADCEAESEEPTP